ncbi:MAG TPA: RNA polymerase sigma factor [Chloroflexia bacterium]|nr:RNA polymerase sigma factor [Chloroflexia bacterium]
MIASDAELVTSLKKREARAVELLLQQFADRLYNYAYYHSGDHHLAEDIVSETFTRIIEKIGNYEQREVPFKAWVFRIAHNLLVDHFRRHSRYRAVSLDEIDWESGPPVIPSSDWGAADGGELAQQMADRDELQSAVARLPEEQRTVFILRFIDGLELEQVASALDKSLASIKSLQYRAVRNLRALLDQPSPVDSGNKYSSDFRR